MKIPVGILGATGVIGQHYVALLHNHPWFEITQLAASEPAESYKDAVANRWYPASPIPKGYAVSSLDAITSCPLIFSALPNTLAEKYEPLLARKGCYVISSASCHRESHPLIIPEINPHHIGKNRLITKPNCTTQSFLLPLAPLHKASKIVSLSVTTLQAMSGAGSHAPPLCENVIPYIEDEEAKLESEPLKILEASFPISAHCNRVPVVHGHLTCVSVSFERKLSREEILTIWNQKSSLALPSAPEHPVAYTDTADRPQPLLDRDAAGGMCVTVGRLRHCPLFDWRFVALSHNAIRGGAGGGVLIAEYLKEEGLLG